MKKIVVSNEISRPFQSVGASFFMLSPGRCGILVSALLRGNQP